MYKSGVTGISLNGEWVNCGEFTVHSKHNKDFTDKYVLFFLLIGPPKCARYSLLLFVHRHIVRVLLRPSDFDLLIDL